MTATPISHEQADIGHVGIDGQRRHASSPRR